MTTYYVWIDLQLNDILAIPKKDAKDKFLEQLKYENIELSVISGESTLEVIQKFKSEKNAHTQVFMENKTPVYH